MIVAERSSARADGTRWYVVVGDDDERAWEGHGRGLVLGEVATLSSPLLLGPCRITRSDRCFHWDSLQVSVGIWGLFAVGVSQIDRHGVVEEKAVDRISRELLQHDVATEAYGGQVPIVPVSMTRDARLT